MNLPRSPCKAKVTEGQKIKHTGGKKKLKIDNILKKTLIAAVSVATIVWSKLKSYETTLQVTKNPAFKRCHILVSLIILLDHKQY